MIEENRARVKADGPGFRVKLNKHDGLNLRPIQCENGTYRIVSGIFQVTQRASSGQSEPRSGHDQATVFGPFFVLPFNTTVVMC